VDGQARGDAAALALLVPLARRACQPVVLIGTVAAVGIVSHWLPRRVTGIEAFGMILVLVVYSVAAHTRGWRAWLSGGFTAAFGINVLFTDPDGASFSGIVFFTLLFGAPWLAGKVVQRRRAGSATPVVACTSSLWVASTPDTPWPRRDERSTRARRPRGSTTLPAPAS
jgi:hypothetical protein